MLIKVCCIQNESELQMAARAGATHVGLVGAMPSGPGPIDDEAIRRIAATAPLGLTTVLLTSRSDPEAIIEHLQSTHVRAVQIVSYVRADVRRAVRQALPTIEILQVVHVEGPASIEIAAGAAEAADYVLLDSGRPAAATPELGGTGRTHDWSISRRIVETLDVPVLLAGGLGPSNVRGAIDAVRPAGVDLCSGLRDVQFRLDAQALESFVHSARSA